MTFIEHRRAPRFWLQLPILVRWSDDTGAREAPTVTKDVSSNGVYFLLAQPIKNGTPVEIEMTLPNKITLAGPVKVRCLGHVQRCEIEEDAKVGMAAEPSLLLRMCASKGILCQRGVAKVSREAFFGTKRVTPGPSVSPASPLSAAASPEVGVRAGSERRPRWVP